MKVFVVNAVDLSRDALGEPLKIFRSKEEADAWIKAAEDHFAGWRVTDIRYADDPEGWRLTHQRWLDSSPVPGFAKHEWECFEVFELQLED